MLPLYRILRYRHLDKDLARVPEKQRVAIRAAIGALAGDPRPRGAKRLQGQRADESYHRLRVGRYRVVYDIDDETRVVRVILVGPRKDVYRIVGRR